MPSKPNPFDEIERMFDRMSQQFEALDPTDIAGSLGGIAVDVRDEGDRFVVTADLPGYTTEDIDVTLPEETSLRVSAQRTSDISNEEGVFVRRERRRESASRTVSLPDRVASEDTEATYQNGVLTVTLLKAEPDDEGGRSIPVN